LIYKYDIYRKKERGEKRERKKEESIFLPSDLSKKKGGGSLEGIPLFLEGK
jgi:hypothetical protein